MFPVQRIPVGLLELLGQKGSGAGPRSLAEQLTGTMDLTGFYLRSVETGVSGQTAAINAQGYWQATGAVPAGEIWLVHSLAVSSAAAMGAAEQQLLALAARDSALNVRALERAQQFAPSTRVAFGLVLPWPMAFGPGNTFGLYSQASSTGAIQLTVTVHFYRLAF